MRLFMHALGVFVLAVAAGVLVSGCTPSPAGNGPQQGEVVKSDKARELSPTVDAADLAALVAGNSAFALDLYGAIRDEDGNLFYSPFSISIALAMTYAGAGTRTEQQMAEALHFTLSQAKLHPAFNALDLALAGRGADAAGADGEGFRLNVANAIWGQKDYSFVSDYLDVLALHYGAGLRVLDFMSDPESARLVINGWVNEETEGKITDLISQGMLTTATRLVLTNAVYFNAAWAYPFEEEVTQDGTFHRLDGTEQTVPMMSQTEDFRYAEGPTYQAVELPYDGYELSMVIVLPAAGSFDDFEDSFDAAQVDTIVNSLASRRVALTMPTFTYESEFLLGQTLSGMGMSDAFSGYADFSGIAGVPGDLMIGEVVHKTFIRVDEAGTEAAAATAVIMELTAMPDEQEIVEVTVDRPFVFLIRDIETRAILFIGRVLVVNPPE